MPENSQPAPDPTRPPPENRPAARPRAEGAASPSSEKQTVPAAAGSAGSTASAAGASSAGGGAEPRSGRPEGGSEGRTAVATLPGTRPGQSAGRGGPPQQGGPPGGVVLQTPPLHGPWVNVSVFGRRWPGPGRSASPATTIALLVAAVVAALSVPLDRGGVGWLVTAVGGVAALIVARALPAKPPPTAPKPLVRWSAQALTRARFGWSAATVALLAVGTFRAAGWLYLLCLATALLTGALAVAGGRSMRGMVAAACMAPVAGFRSLPWVARGLTTARRGANSNRVRVTATVLVSFLLLVVFGSLFASADAAFADLISAAVPDLDGGTVARWIFVFVVTVGILGGAAFLRAAPPDLSGLDTPGRSRVARLEWAIPLTLLTLLFAMFVAVQLTVLFGGSEHVLDTEGLTYAEYARGGFWQLLVVTGLTLLVLAGAARWAPREARTDRVLVRAVLGALSALTLVIVASALHRMNVYADTYGLTRLRVLVFLCEVWLGVVFLLVLAAGIRLRATWLPRAVVAAGVLALLGLAVANPDRLIADRNVSRYQQTSSIDTAYLSDLSADAVPALDRLTGEKRDCALAPIDNDLDRDPDDWRGWNLGRAQARDLLDSRPPNYSRDCPYR